VSERKIWESLRPWPVYVMAAAVPVSLAATNIAKVVMFLFALAVALAALAQGRRLPLLASLRTPAVVLLLISLLALTLLYTTAPMDIAVHDYIKFTKLLVIPLVLILMRSRREVLIALAAYVVMQTFVVVTSYLLSMNLDVPWVFKADRLSLGTVYSSYLDQSIMTVGFGVLAWHLRGEFPGRHGNKLAMVLAVLCAVNVLLLLPGRSGQVALAVAGSLALLRGLPAHNRPAALFAPLLVIAFVMAVSPHFRDRASAVVSEARAYSQGDPAPTSSGVRLNYWQRSVEALVERPLTGYGVGSWNTEYRRLEGDQLRADAMTVRNPHQEYLLWGVQMGLGGIALLLLFLATLWRDASRFAPAERDAAQSLVVVFAVVCLFNSALFDALIGDYFCVLLGLLLALGLHRKTEPSPG